MNIILFGGSFNPPHLSHQIVVSQAFELIPNIHELWLLPDYQHAFAKGKFFINSKHRLNMVKLLESKNVRTETCTFDHKMPGNTIFHITHLQKQYPQHQFSFLMGSDNLKTFHQWSEYKSLLKLMPFYIYPRANSPFRPFYQNMFTLEHPLQIITNISSTMIRNRLEKHLSVNRLIPKKISQYISKHQLYT